MSFLDKATGALGGASNITDMVFSAHEARKSRKWSQQMDNTKYQRAVADMRAAGLNPILAATKGVTTGSGASAPGSPTGKASEGTQASTAKKLSVAQIDNIKKDTEKKEEEKRMLRDQALYYFKAAANQEANAAKGLADRDLILVETLLRNMDIPGKRFEMQMDQDQRGEISRLLKRYPQLESLFKALGFGAGAGGVYLWKKGKKRRAEKAIRKKYPNW